MKTKLLLFTLTSFLLLKTNAQIHPGSMWSNTFVYDATPHVHETWFASGYKLYDINMTKDANGYITGIQTSTPPPFNTNMDQYKSTGSRTGQVYTALTLKQTKNTTPWYNWRKETWQGDGTNDTAMFWQDSINGAWTNIIKHVVHYNGSTPDYVTDYTWVNNAWAVSTKMTMTYVAGKRDLFTNYNWISATSTWKQYGYVQYYYSTKLDSLKSWSTDTSGVSTIKQKYYFTTDGTGKTTSLSAYDWDATNNKWVSGVTIYFDNVSTVLREIASSNSETTSVYPIPADNNINVRTENGLNGTVHITDLCGREVLSQCISQTETSITTTGLTNGIYLMSIEKDGRISSQRKIVINH